MGCAAAHVKRSVAFLLCAAFCLAAAFSEAAGDYAVNQNVRQTVRYIRGNQQFIIQATYLITGVEEAKSIGSGMLLQKAEGKFIIVRFKVLNKGAIPVPSSILLDLILIDGRKSRWEQSLSATAALKLDAERFKKAEIAADREVEDVIAFDVPPALQDYYILLPGGAKVSPVSSGDRPDTLLREIQKTAGRDAASDDKESGAKPGTVTATVAENAAHLRARPSLEADPVSWTTKGTVLEVTGEHREENGRKWYRVKTANGRQYWIVGKVVKVRKEQAKATGEPAGTRPFPEPKPKPEPAKPAEEKPATVKPVPEPKPETKPAEPVKTVDEAQRHEKPGAKPEIAGDRKMFVTITSNAATLREQPSSGSGAVTWTRKGVVFEVLERMKDSAGKKWYKVKTQGGAVGWLRDIVVQESGEEPVKQPGPAKAAAKTPEPAKTETSTGESKAAAGVKAEVKPPGRTADKTVEALPEKQSEQAKEKAARVREKSVQGETQEKMTATVTEDAAHLRARPSLEADPVSWTTKGTALEVTGEHREENGRKWYRVKTANGRQYWIVGKVVKIRKEQTKVTGEPAGARPLPEPGPEPKPARPTAEKHEEQPPATPGAVKTSKKRIVTVIANSATLRAEPSFDAEKTGKVSKGAVLEVVEDMADPTGKTWFKVKAPAGKESWISDSVANVSPFSLIDDRFVKVEPGDSAQIIIKERSSEEAKAKPGGKAKKGEQGKRKTLTVTNEFAILRAEPSKEAKVITWAPKGTTFEIIGELKDTSGRKWYKVKSSNDTECWIADTMVSLSMSGADAREGAAGDRKVADKTKKPTRKEQASSARLGELLDKAAVLYKEGKCEDFIAVNEEAISIVSGQKDRTDEGSLHYSVAECFVLLNRHADAVKHLERAIDLARETGNRELEMLAFIGRNRVLIMSGDRENAAALFREINDKADREVFLNVDAPNSLKASAAFQMAHILLDIGDELRARDKLEYTLLVNHDFKMEDELARVLKIVGSPAYEEMTTIDKMLEEAWSSYEKGDYKVMESRSRQALDSAKRIYYKRGIFNGNYYLAVSMAGLGEKREAMIYVQDAREAAEKGSDEAGLGMVYNLMGNIFEQGHEPEQAFYYSHKYLEIARRQGDRNGEAAALNNIGNVLMDVGDYKQALQYYEDSLRIILGAGTARHLAAQGYLSLGRAQKKTGDYGKAAESIAQAKNIFGELGNAGGELAGAWEMAGNYGLQGEYGPAIKILEDNLQRSEDMGLKQNFVDDLIVYAEKTNDPERSEKYRKMKGN